ncbi:MAG TPA: NAD/NADP octopine/nopaline dehydrogenase family protein [Bacillota bacterium]|jgi:opine dehydrogenase
MRVAVLGGGNGAFITAADLAGRGHQVRIFEVPEFAKALDGVRERGGIELEVRGNLDLPAGFFPVEATADAARAVEGAEAVLLVVPAFGQKRFAQLVAPYLKDGQVVMMSPGNFGGAIEFARTLKESGCKGRPIIMESECMIYSGFKGGPSSAWVSGFKNGMKAAAFPAVDGERGIKVLKQIYPLVQLADDVIETGLGNVNTVFHAPILVLNAGRVESDKDEFLFYWEGCSPSVGRVVEGVEAERLAIGRALGTKLPPFLEVMLGWYGHQGAKGETLAKVMATNPAYEWDTAPRNLRHRFLMEDIPYGMVPMEELGRLVGVRTPLTTAVIELACELLGEDLRVKARGLSYLGLAGLNKEQFMEVMKTGKGYWPAGR